MSYEWQKRRLSSARVPDKFHQFRTLTGLADLRRSPRRSPRQRSTHGVSLRHGPHRQDG